MSLPKVRGKQDLRINLRMNLFELDPNNPIPLYSLDNILRQGCKEHSLKLDQHLGFDIQGTEQKVQANKASADYQHKETWTHISPQVFQTSYVELRFIMEQLLEINPHIRTLADLGAAYFRIQFVNSIVFNDRFDLTGVELCKERILEAQRVYKKYFGTELKNLIQGDLCGDNFVIPRAEVYFIYDFGTHSDVETVLAKLLVQNSANNSFLLVGRGARVRDILQKQFSDFVNPLSQNNNFGIWSYNSSA